jgi:hypothetical protein
MRKEHLTDQRLAEIREALTYTDWRRFDRDDVTMLVNEVDRLRAEVRRNAGAEDAVQVAAERQGRRRGGMLRIVPAAHVARPCSIPRGGCRAWVLHRMRSRPL